MCTEEEETEDSEDSVGGRGARRCGSGCMVTNQGSSAKYLARAISVQIKKKEGTDLRSARRENRER